MRELARFDATSDAIAGGFAQVRGAHGLVLVGSAAAAGRRDRWSDHDFLALVEAAGAAAARERLDWLPEPERIVLAAREGELGFSVLYDDAHLLEFAVASLDELSNAPIGDARLAFGDERAVSFVAEGRARAERYSEPDAANETGLAFVKLLVGYGRARRGERIVAGQFIRVWAVGHLLKAIRLRVVPSGVDQPDPLEAARRFDAAYPEIAAALDEVLASPLENAARGILSLARETLEPGWGDFPARAADVLQAVLDED